MQSCTDLFLSIDVEQSAGSHQPPKGWADG